MPNNLSTSATQASWRDLIPVHPAAELFPRLSDDELLKLGEDIRARGVVFPLAFYRDREGRVSLLDGVSRLDAMERENVEFKITYKKKISISPRLCRR